MVDLDEVAHHEPPHQDLRCLQIQLFSSLVVKKLKVGSCSFECIITLLIYFLKSANFQKMLSPSYIILRI